MTKISSLATATAVVSLLLMGAASAQTTAPAKTDATKTEAKAPAEKKAEKPRTSASLECSKEADAKGLARQGTPEIPLRVQEDRCRKGEITIPPFLLEGGIGTSRISHDAGGPSPASPCIAAIAWRICPSRVDLP